MVEARYNAEKMASIIKNVQKNAPRKSEEERRTKEERIAKSRALDDKWNIQKQEHFFKAKGEGHAKRHRIQEGKRREHPTLSGRRQR